MARFKWLGIPQWGSIVFDQPATVIRVKHKDGTVHVYEPVEPATEFVVDEDFGHEVIEDRCLRHLRADSRFEEII